MFDSYLERSSRVSLLLTYLHHKCCQATQNGQECQAAYPAHIDMREHQESSPAQLLGGVRRVTHTVDSFHLKLLDQTAAQVAELVKAVPAVVAAHTTVTLGRGGRVSQSLTSVSFISTHTKKKGFK